ncbi:MAG: hypothetical protein RIS94_1865 [Pseudomonadota bacterium]|jgi:DNA primase
MMARINIDAIRRDNPLPDVAGKLVALRPAGREWVACCPFHSDRSPSFTIYHGGERFHCFGCGASGDVLDFVQRAYAVDLIEAARMLGAGEVPTLDLPKPAAPVAVNTETIGAARAIWNRAVPAAGTLAESYLRFRGISFPRSLRLCASCAFPVAIWAGCRALFARCRMWTGRLRVSNVSGWHMTAWARRTWPNPSDR